MTPFQLHPHPDCPPKARLIIKARASRPRDDGHPRKDSGQFILSFSVHGEIERLNWNEPGREGRADELWRHGCFEAFIIASAQGYAELNFAPAKQWAAYAFDDYRDGMRDESEAIVHKMEFYVRNLSVPRVEMQVRVELPERFAGSEWRLGLSVIIEEKDGTKSYWALAHAPGPPDFHNPDCFTARLPAPADP
jgi:hypothetical protein